MNKKVAIIGNGNTGSLARELLEKTISKKIADLKPSCPTFSDFMLYNFPKYKDHIIIIPELHNIDSVAEEDQFLCMDMSPFLIINEHLMSEKNKQAFINAFNKSTGIICFKQNSKLTSSNEIKSNNNNKLI